MNKLIPNPNNLIFPSVMDVIKRLQEFNLDANTQRLLDYYDSPSYMEMMGVSRTETAHSALLAYLLNSEQSHQLGKRFFLYFLEMVLGKAVENSDQGIIEFNIDVLHQELLIRNLQISSIVSATEYPITNGRIDILLFFDIFLEGKTENYVMVIENKVGSTEGRNSEKAQTDYYYEEISRRFPNHKRLFVYLTPSGLPHCKNLNFVHVTYQDMLDQCIQPCIDQDNITSQTKFILKDYVKSLSKPAISNDKKSKYKIIMGIGNQEKTLLIKFWEKYKDLIQTAATAVATDESNDFDEEERKAAEQVAKTIEKSSRKYGFQIGNDPTVRKMTPTVVELVKKYVDENGDSLSFDELQQVFSPIPNRSNMVFKSAGDVIGGTYVSLNLQKALKSGEQQIYVAKNIWNRKPEFEGLIAISKKLGQDYEIKEVQS